MQNEQYPVSAMTEQQRQTLIESCLREIKKDPHSPHAQMAKISLSALTPAPVQVLLQVESPNAERLDGNGHGYYFDMNGVFEALDAAGAKYEVKE